MNYSTDNIRIADAYRRMAMSSVLSESIVADPDDGVPRGYDAVVHYEDGDDDRGLFHSLRDAARFIGSSLKKAKAEGREIGYCHVFADGTEDGIGRKVSPERYWPWVEKELRGKGTDAAGGYGGSADDGSADDGPSIEVLKVPADMRVSRSSDGSVVIRGRRGGDGRYGQDGYGIAAELGSLNGFAYDVWIDVNGVEVGRDFIAIPDGCVGRIERMSVKRWRR